MDKNICIFGRNTFKNVLYYYYTYILHILHCKYQRKQFKIVSNQSAVFYLH